MQNKNKPNNNQPEVKSWGLMALEGFVESSGAEQAARRAANEGKIAKHAIREASFAMLSNAEVRKNKGYETNLSRQLLLAAKIPGWLESQSALDEIREDLSSMKRLPWSKRDHEQIAEIELKKQQHLDKMIDFNHLLRRMIDAEQFTKVSQVKKFAKSVLIAKGSVENDLNRADQYMGWAVNGMRHEIAAESVLNNMKGVSAEGASLEQEKMGIDLIIEKDGHTVLVDIKSTQRGADESNSKHHSTLAVWSGFENRDFGDDILLDEEQLHSPQTIRYYESVLEQLDQHAKVA